MALTLRDNRAAYYIKKGYDQEEAITAATISMLVLAYRTAVAETAEGLTDDISAFLEGQ